jgi:hypothetical protein
MPDLLISSGVAVIVGWILLLLLSRPIGRFQFSFSTAFWCSFIAHVLISIVGLVIGWLFAYHLEIGFIITLAIGWIFLTVLLQIAARARAATLRAWRAAILSIIVIVGDFLIASPTSVFIQNLMGTSH